ncbi:MAG: hypothetical protein ACR2NR_14375 [Solirubrobacteraceae bacterium]
MPRFAASPSGDAAGAADYLSTSKDRIYAAVIGEEKARLAGAGMLGRQSDGRLMPNPGYYGWLAPRRLGGRRVCPRQQTRLNRPPPRTTPLVPFT